FYIALICSDFLLCALICAHILLANLVVCSILKSPLLLVDIIVVSLDLVFHYKPNYQTNHEGDTVSNKSQNDANYYTNNAKFELERRFILQTAQISLQLRLNLTFSG